MEISIKCDFKTIENSKIRGLLGDADQEDQRQHV